MQNRRTGRIVVAAIAVLTALVAVAAMSGNIPALTRTWGTIASSVAAAASSLAIAPPRPDDAGVQMPDAGPEAGARKQTAPLSSGQLGAPLIHGAFVSSCGAPDTMKVVMNVTVKMGRAVAVVVETQPSDPVVAACIERATRELKWDISPKTDHVTVRY